ncbi:MAG: ZIP family metal transporter [Clostridium sp.]|nr:ZIP family metal transporter [Clostridium sp.]MCM1443998.1 ZIP family metal transporter [Candidatus Amulumruptor caecigallinarius]
MNNILLGFILTTIAGFSTMIGTLLIFFKKNKKIIISSLAFASGVMLCVSLTDLIPESVKLINEKFNTIPTILLVLIFIVIGIIISSYINLKLPIEKKENNGLYKVGIFSMFAIIAHNIPEGIATFLATSTDTSLGIMLTIAIALHNIPEGISISIPIYYSLNSKKKAIGYTLISALSEPFGALLAYIFLSRVVNNQIMGYIFSSIAGIMIYISLYELLPTSFKYKDKKRTIILFIIGIIFMYINSILF